MTTDRNEAILGTVLDGRYRVEAVIGAAHAGGTVFRGRDASAGATVVVRCPHVPEELDAAARKTALDAFLREASKLAELSARSSDVERLLAYGVAELSGGEVVPYTVFEWLAGRALERHLAERAPGGGSIGEALVILEPAARALAAAHAMGIAHRDVRPANLWLAEIGGRTTLKVAAFALATRIGPGETSFAPEYAAPEHFKRTYGGIGPATDVYGLALCLVELVTGRRALEGADAGELYLATSDLAKRPTLRARGAHPSDALEGVITRALAVDPKRRWQTARELWDALVAVVPELTPAPPSVRAGGAGGGAPGITTESASMKADSPPASLPPGLVGARPTSVLGVAPGASVPPLAEDARLADSIKSAPMPTAAHPSSRPGDASGKAGTRDSGSWAWLAIAVIGVVAVAVVVAKVGKPVGAGGPLGSGSTRAVARASAAPIAIAAGDAGAAAPTEKAVSVRPFLTDMIKVPPGRFTMGSDTDGKGERPPHEVTITRAFYIDRTEVRADAYAACVADGACTPNRVHAGETVDTTWGCNTDKERPTHPANCVDRAQAAAYCAYALKRLPTEAEWEYAARGTDGRDYPWGKAPPTTCAQAILVGLNGDCAERKGTGEVGTTAEGKSAFGALDMAGNVWEWVEDGYDAYPSGAVSDPKVPLAPSGKGVLRGGSWDYAVTSAKATYRLPFMPTSGNVSVGFRCARDAE